MVDCPDCLTVMVSGSILSWPLTYVDIIWSGNWTNYSRERLDIYDMHVSSTSLWHPQRLAVRDKKSVGHLLPPYLCTLMGTKSGEHSPLRMLSLGLLHVSGKGLCLPDPLFTEVWSQGKQCVFALLCALACAAFLAFALACASPFFFIFFSKKTTTFFYTNAQDC